MEVLENCQGVVFMTPVCFLSKPFQADLTSPRVQDQQKLSIIFVVHVKLFRFAPVSTPFVNSFVNVYLFIFLLQVIKYSIMCKACVLDACFMSASTARSCPQRFIDQVYVTQVMLMRQYKDVFCAKRSRSKVKCKGQIMSLHLLTLDTTSPNPLGASSKHVLLLY